MNSVEAKTGRIVFARFTEDEDLLEAITKTARGNRISVGFLILIGSLKKAKVGFYHQGKYEAIEINEPLEIVSCMGNVSIKEGEPFVHAHIVVSNRNGEAFGGHVMPGCTVAATAELVLIEALDMKLERKRDEKTRLHLWSIGR